MADGCINTHMARLLGAPPLLDDIYNIYNVQQKVPQFILLNKEK